MQDHAADQLDVKRSQAEHAARGFAHDGKGRDQNVVERLAVGEQLAEFDRLGRELLVASSAFVFSSIALMASTFGWKDRTRRSLEDPNILRARPPKLTI